MSYMKNAFFILTFLLLIPLSAFAQQFEYEIPKTWVKVKPKTLETEHGKVPSDVTAFLNQKGCQWVALSPKLFKTPNRPLMVVTLLNYAEKGYELNEANLDKVLESLKAEAATGKYGKVVEAKVFMAYGVKLMRIVLDSVEPQSRQYVRTLQYYFKDGDNLAMVAYSCLAFEFQTYAPIFQNSVMTTLKPKSFGPKADEWGGRP